MASGRSTEGGPADPRTPMAWQHRDLNYHQSGYQDRYGPGADGGRMQGPPSTSDRLSHRTDKTWNTHKDSNQGLLPPYNQQHYPPRDYPTSTRDYPHSRELSPSEQFSPQQQYQQRQQDSRHSATATSTISSSSSEDDSEQPGPQGPAHPVYGYNAPAGGGGAGGGGGGYYPGYPPPSSHAGGYPPSMAAAVAAGYHHHGGGGTMKSAKSVPALLAATYDGEPCPVHHNSVMGGPPHPHPMSLPHPMMHPGYATMGHPRRAASIYDMRIMSPPPPATIYGTLPHHLPPPPPADARSMMGGSNVMGPAAPGAPLGIPPQLLPPMARPRPVVIGEGGAAEVLPVRGRNDKELVATLPKSILASKGAAAASGGDVEKPKKPFCCHGGTCVCFIILGVIVVGVLLTLMLLFIL